MGGKYWRLLECLECEKPQAAIVEVEDVTKIGSLELDESAILVKLVAPIGSQCGILTRLEGEE